MEVKFKNYVYILHYLFIAKEPKLYSQLAITYLRIFHMFLRFLEINREDMGCLIHCIS